ncbi:MAG: four helix bundle protein [Bacteroidales bacterium]|jgi:four helix bundle protein|nr:four helix bundle protein [Bacteroidales bacterium]
MRENVVKTKTFAFAARMVRLYGYLNENKREYVLSKQVLRSGTSIGTNIEEGEVAQSKKDFIAKFSIRR